MMASLGHDLRNLIGRSKTVAFVYGTVGEVDAETDTMSVSIGSEVTLPDISLAPIQGGNANALLYPKAGSVVIIGFVEDRPELSFVVAMTEVDRIHVRFDYGKDPAEDSITADAEKVEIVRGKGGDASSVSITPDAIALERGNSKVEVSSGKVDINNGHLTIT